MSSFPGAAEILAVYRDHLEALERLLRDRALLSADRKSLFHGLADDEIQSRLERDRDELDRWTVLVLVASFEATLRADMDERIDAKTKDAIRRPLRHLRERYGNRVRLADILELWDAHATIGAAAKQSLRTLLHHRHWLAHGRHWVNKHGAVPSPLEARATLDDYTQALQACSADFPRA